MQEQSPGLIEALNTLIGGAATTLIAAFTGRLMYHAGEVRARRRPIWSRDLLWELPMVIGMGLIGDALATYLGLAREVGIGLVSVVAYLGPRGAGVLFERWFARGS